MKETVKNYLSNSVKQMVHEGRLKNLAKKGEDSGTIMRRDGFGNFGKVRSQPVVPRH